MFISNGSAQIHLIDFQFTHSMQKHHTRACIATPLDRNFRLLGVWQDRKQSTGLCTTEHTIDLQLEYSIVELINLNF